MDDMMKNIFNCSHHKYGMNNCIIVIPYVHRENDDVIFYM